MRVVFIDGPGDAIESFNFWQEGLDNPNVTHIAFSQQLFDACRKVDAEVLVLAEHNRLESLVSGKFVVEHLGDPTAGKSGLAYHLAIMRRAVSLVVKIVRFRADVVVSTDRPYPFLLHALRLFGIKTVINLHCVLWCKHGAPGRVGRWLNRLNATFYRSGCAAIACVSEDIRLQVQSLCKGSPVPFVDFLPWLRAEAFDQVAPPDFGRGPARILFAGRIETNKGVFDLLEIARRLKARGRSDIVFDLCGTGSAWDELRAQALTSGVEDTFLLHGHCNRQRMLEAFGSSHLVVVPTRTSFNEGFNMVVVEALLAKRPVITSDVCPAAEYVSSAVQLVPPDDVGAYEEAIVRLVDDRDAYLQLQTRSFEAGLRFTREATSYRAAFVHILDCIKRGRPVTSREISTSQATVGAES